MIFKRKIVGYIHLILNTGYEVIPNIRCQITKKASVSLLDNNYWFQNTFKKTIFLYKKDVEKLNTAGFDLEEFSYKRRVGYDDALFWSKRKIINTLIKNEKD